MRAGGTDGAWASLPRAPPVLLPAGTACRHGGTTARPPRNVLAEGRRAVERRVGKARDRGTQWWNGDALLSCAAAGFLLKSLRCDAIALRFIVGIYFLRSVAVTTQVDPDGRLAKLAKRGMDSEPALGFDLLRQLRPHNVLPASRTKVRLGVFLCFVLIVQASSFNRTFRSTRKQLRPSRRPTAWPARHTRMMSVITASDPLAGRTRTVWPWSSLIERDAVARVDPARAVDVVDLVGGHQRVVLRDLCNAVARGGDVVILLGSAASVRQPRHRQASRRRNHDGKHTLALGWKGIREIACVSIDSQRVVSPFPVLSWLGWSQERDHVVRSSRQNSRKLAGLRHRRRRNGRR